MLLCLIHLVHSQAVDERRIREYLEKHRGDWHEMNVPFQDGQLLYDLFSRTITSTLSK